MSVFTYLDSSGRTRGVKIDGWNDGMEHWGRYGAWTYFNLNPMDLSVVISDESVYSGDGMDKHWHIKWS